MKYNFLEQNPDFQGKDDEYIMRQSYVEINGIGSAKPLYDYEDGGRKTQQTYSYTFLNGRVTDAIVNLFEDIYNSENELIAVNVKHIWVRNGTKNLVKETIKDLSYKDVITLKSGRRSNIKVFLLSEAEKSENPLVPLIFDVIFDYLQLGLNTWIETGKHYEIYRLIDNAPIIDNDVVISIFEKVYGVDNVPNELKSLKSLFYLDSGKNLIENEVVVRKMKIHEYLKHFIK
jgi:hypothetical protein